MVYVMENTIDKRMKTGVSPMTQETSIYEPSRNSQKFAGFCFIRVCPMVMRFEYVKWPSKWAVPILTAIFHMGSSKAMGSSKVMGGTPNHPSYG